MIADFADTREGGFFSTAGDHESLLARPKDPFDGALPSGNSVAIRNLVALAAATGEGALPRPGRPGARRLQRHPGREPRRSPLDARRPGRIPRRPARRRAAVAAAPADALPGGQTVVEATAAPAPGAVVVAGGEFDVIVTLVVKDGWHLYANPTGAAFSEADHRHPHRRTAGHARRGPLPGGHRHAGHSRQSREGVGL